MSVVKGMLLSAIAILLAVPFAFADVATSTAEATAAKAFEPPLGALSVPFEVTVDGKRWLVVNYYYNDIAQKNWYYLGRVVMEPKNGKVTLVNHIADGVPDDDIWYTSPTNIASTSGELAYDVTEDQAIGYAAAAYGLPSDHSVYQTQLLPGETQMYYVIDFVRYDSFSGKTYWGFRAVVDPYSGEVFQDPSSLQYFHARLTDVPEGFDPRTKELLAEKKSLASDAQRIFESPSRVVGIMLLICALIGLPFVLRRVGIKVPTRKVLDISFGIATIAQLLLAVYFLRYSEGQSLSSLWIFISAMGTVTSWISARFFLQQQNPGGEPANFKPLNEGDVKKLGWDNLILDPGTLSELKRIVSRIENPDALSQLGVDPPKGILLYGPPGTGKTTIAKVLANEAKAAFFSISIAEIYTMWFGQSQQRIHELFEEARKHKPSIIFIDEIDSLMSQRGRSSAGYEDTITNQVLQEIDGIRDSNYVFVVGATNAPDTIDSALLRGGRLSTQIEIPSPGKAEREKLFKLFLKKTPLDADVSLEELAMRTEGCSGADIKDICEQAILVEFEEHKSTTLALSRADLMKAIDGYARNSRVYRVPDYFKKRATQ